MLKRTGTICLLAVLAGCDGSPLPEAVMVAGDLRSTPWPSDVLLGSDGHLVVAPPFPFAAETPAAALLAQALSEADGFGTVTAVFFPVNAALSVDPGATARVVDLEGSEPPRAFSLLYRAATRQLVAVAPPGTVLREHHRYGCVVSGGVHDSAGNPLRPSKAMADLLAGGPTAPGSDQLLAPPLGGRAGTAGGTGGTPQAATAFTTQTVSAWAAKALADVAALPLVAVP